MKSLSGRGICTRMFIAALFTTAKTWKQPKCPLTNEWIKKIRYIWNGYYPAIKKKEILLLVITWMTLEGNHTKFSKSERERQILYDLTYIRNLKQNKTKNTS